jgi:hypothetical protein
LGAVHGLGAGPALKGRLNWRLPDDCHYRHRAKKENQTNKNHEMIFIGLILDKLRIQIQRDKAIGSYADLTYPALTEKDDPGPV